MNLHLRAFSYKNQKRTRKRFPARYFIFVIIFLFFPGFHFFVLNPLYADENKKNIPREYIDTVAISAIVEDFNSDRILWEKNSDEIIYPASITKIMTAIIALEKIDDLNEIATISENARGRNFSSIYFRVMIKSP